VETSGGIQASLAGRYASALFDLARDERQIDAVGRSLDSLKRGAAESRDLAEAGRSPRWSAARTPAKALRRARPGARPRSDHHQLPRRARPQRPQAQLPDVIRAFGALAAEHRGETTAEVTQRPPARRRPDRRAQGQLGARAGRDVTHRRPVDPAILGGIVVKLGSQMIDARSAPNSTLSRLAMKG
jgi:F-type H+-transporting ATPase subunit delta